MMSEQRFCFLTPAQLHRLREAAEPIGDAFGSYGAYLVGSCLERADYRDVDVRIILKDERFVELFGQELDQYPGHATALWMSLTVLYSADLSRTTGLTVDCQFQAASWANVEHSGRRRDALMMPPYLEPPHDR